MRRALLLGALLLASGLWWFHGGATGRGLVLTALDVGQGDAVLIRTPDGTDVLVDTGRGRAVVDQLGAVLPPADRSLELLVLTHPDADHIGGTPSVLAHYGVERAWVSGAESGTATDRTVASALAEHRVETESVLAGRTAELADGTRLAVLWPKVTPGTFSPSRAGSPHGGTNDASVVLRITYREFCAVLTGDASDAVEADLVASGALSRCAVLKVGHHGSRYSSSEPFLAALHPQLALIGVGAGNPYGHPAPAALRRLAAVGATVLRTDRNGRITVRFDGAYHVSVQRGASP